MKRELQLEVICGTYEEFVVGYQLFKYTGNEEMYRFEQAFADHSHTASVRAVACHNHLLASGGADEIVKLYNMKRRNEMGQLLNHEGTITCLQFHGRHHLLSGSKDGRVAVVRVDNWQCERHLGRHRGGVTHLSVHPSGRIALTVGRDRKLLTWDLVKGRVAFRINLGAAAEFVHWAPDGSTYAVGVQGRCDVYSVASAGVVHALQTAAKINCATYLSPSLLFCGDEAGGGAVFHLSGGQAGRGVSWQPHATRVRACCALRRDEHLCWLVSADSAGLIKVWQTPVESITEAPQLIASYDTTCRLTSVTVHVPPDRRFPPETAADVVASRASRTSTGNGSDGEVRSATKSGSVDGLGDEVVSSDTAEEEDGGAMNGDSAGSEVEDDDVIGDEDVLNEEEELNEDSFDGSSEEAERPPRVVTKGAKRPVVHKEDEVATPAKKRKLKKKCKGKTVDKGRSTNEESKTKTKLAKKKRSPQKHNANAKSGISKKPKVQQSPKVKVQSPQAQLSGKKKLKRRKKKAAA